MRSQSAASDRMRKAKKRTGPVRGDMPAHSRLLILVTAAVLCAVTGLAAGMLTRGVVDVLSHASPSATSTRNSPSPTQTPAAPTATAPSAPIIVAPSGFRLSAAVQPNAGAPGQHLTVTATIVAADGATPLAGVRITLQAPERDVPGLLTQWPDPAVSDAQGHATWEVTVPAVAAGIYGVEVMAAGAHGYSFHFVTRVTVTAG